MKYTTVFFDLFFTLITLDYSNDPTENEYGILGLSKKEWEDRNNETYNHRATGETNSSYEMIEYIVRDLNLPKSKIEKTVSLREKRIRNAINSKNEDIFNYLLELKGRGLKLGLISNSDILDITILKEICLEKYFEQIIFSYNVKTTKPNENIYRIALREINSIPKECLFVGDGGHDELYGAKKIGMTTILTTQFIMHLWGEKIPELKKNADYSIENIRGINEILI